MLPTPYHINVSFDSQGISIETVYHWFLLYKNQSVQNQMGLACVVCMLHSGWSVSSKELEQKKLSALYNLFYFKGLVIHQAMRYTMWAK